jgi:hypothetical protein
LRFRWYCRLIWGQYSVFFLPPLLPMMMIRCILPLMALIKTCDTSMPIFFKYWAGCVSCFHGCHEPFVTAFNIKSSGQFVVQNYSCCDVKYI